MAVILLFKQLLTTSFGFWRVLLPQKNSQWDFTKNLGFHRTRFFKNIIESKGPTMHRAELFCVLLRSLPSVIPEPASRWSACPPHIKDNERLPFCTQITDKKQGEPCRSLAVPFKGLQEVLSSSGRCVFSDGQNCSEDESNGVEDSLRSSGIL